MYLKNFQCSTTIHINDIDKKLEKRADVTTCEFFCQTDPKAPSFCAKARFIESEDGPKIQLSFFLVAKLHRPDIYMQKARVHIKNENGQSNKMDWKTPGALLATEINMGCYTVPKCETVTAIFQIAYGRFLLQENPIYTFNETLIKELKNKPVDIEFHLFTGDPSAPGQHIGRISAHKAVLAQYKYFADMFANTSNEIYQVPISDPEVFRTMLDYLYGKLSADRLKKYAVPLCLLADKYGLTKLKVMCERNIVINLNPANVVDVLFLVTTVQCDPIIFHHARALFRNHTSEIPSHDISKIDNCLWFTLFRKGIDLHISQYDELHTSQCYGKLLCYKIRSFYLVNFNKWNDIEHVEGDFS